MEPVEKRSCKDDDKHSTDPKYCSWWSLKSNTSSVEDSFGGFSWPPRCYTCTFCKREFRSAQALGGHMNVHRRDRAMLRQTPSSQTFTFLNHANPNPNFSHMISPSTTARPSSHLFPTGGAPMMKSPFGPCKFDDDRLKLEISLLGESRSDDLDLELRLSCS